ncbi:nucleoside triphosphate pyrophosphatase [Alteromonas sp. D210916BOD_24]|uniref:Maf family protein n=1 Tax=Alteromonas sp. D210916BOD_24 TaxID=3157618 RepID=UPI00399D3C4E
MTPLILASSSQYRKMLLANIGIDVQACAPDIDETPLPGESPTLLSVRLAEQKARKVAEQLKAIDKSAIIIGSDQVALVNTPLGDKLLGKPGTIEKAVEQLSTCQGQCVSFYTALCVYRPATDTAVTRVEETRVQFRQNTTAVLRAYVEKERPLDCAGSFKSEGMGVLLFESIESRDPNSLIGLPIMLLNDLLITHFNVDLLKMAVAN